MGPYCPDACAALNHLLQDEEMRLKFSQTLGDDLNIVRAMNELTAWDKEAARALDKWPTAQRLLIGLAIRIGVSNEMQFNVVGEPDRGPAETTIVIGEGAIAISVKGEPGAGTARAETVGALEF